MREFNLSNTFIKNLSNRGSALIISLLIAFVSMVGLGGLLYAYKISSITNQTLSEDFSNKDMSNSFVNNFFNDLDFSSPQEISIGDYVFKIEPNNNDIENLTVFNSNVELYNALVYKRRNSLYSLYKNGSLISQQVITYSAPSNNMYTSNVAGYKSIDIPFFNINKTTDGNILDQRLLNGAIIDEVSGFAGFIVQNNSSLTFLVKNNQFTISNPSDIGSQYDISLGWSLVKGRWKLYIAIYNNETIYTTSTMLDNLINNSVLAISQLESWNQVNMTNSAGLDGGALSLTEILKVSWFFGDDTNTPSLAIANKNIENAPNELPDIPEEPANIDDLSESEVEEYAERVVEIYEDFVEQVIDSQDCMLDRECPYDQEVVDLLEDISKMDIKDIISNDVKKAMDKSEYKDLKDDFKDMTKDVKEFLKGIKKEYK